MMALPLIPYAVPDLIWDLHVTPEALGLAWGNAAR